MSKGSSRRPEREPGAYEAALDRLTCPVHGWHERGADGVCLKCGGLAAKSCNVHKPPCI